jgi:hypothetical protein
MADLLSKLQAEASAQPQVWRADRFGNRTIALGSPRDLVRSTPEEDYIGAPDGMGGTIDADTAAAMAAYDRDEFETTYGIEPDHPDSLLVKAGLI